MHDSGNGDSGTHEYGNSERNEPTIGRRECLKLAGVVATSVTGVAIESDVVRAASSGYGESGYGEDPFGSDEGSGVST
jgi:hypothetical protein